MKNRNLTILWAATILWASLFSSTFASLENANYLAKKWIIVDKSSNPREYNLNNNILRQEIAVVALGVFWGTTKNYCSWKFYDVSATVPNSWACKTIEALEDHDIISDDNVYFRPQARVTKAEAVAMLVKAGLNKEYNFNPYAWSWQKQIVDFASSRRIVKNFADYNSLATRDFIFDIWANILKLREWSLNTTNTNSWDNSIFNTNNLPKYNNNNHQNQNNSYNQAKVSHATAKTTALRHARLRENQVYGLYIKDDYDDGRLYIEVKFFQNNSRKEFEYKIDAVTGQIVKVDIDYD